MQRIGDGVSAVLHAKLGQDGLYVVANGFGADVQLGSDLTVAAPGAARPKGHTSLATLADRNPAGPRSRHNSNV